MFLLALAALTGHVEAVTSRKASSGYEPKISPPLHDVKSDKKFFGPNGDYGADKRPVPDKKILDQVKKVGGAYPALQSKEDFDTDYVKDENSDKGAWQAQFEYDALRRKLAQEEADAKRAGDRADREGRDADDAQKADDDAGRKVDDAQKDADAAAKGEDDIKRAEDFDGPPSDEKLKELKKAVEAAEERYEQQKKAFEECKKQLENAKKELEDLKAQQKAMEEKLAADTKLWVEQKAVKLNLKKQKEDARFKAHSEKMNAAQAKLAAAEKNKADMAKALAKEKAESDKAQDKLKKEKADVEKVQQQLDAAGKKLQNLHGYKPAQAAATPATPPKVKWWQSLFR